MAENTLTGSPMRDPRYLLADSTTAGSRQLYLIYQLDAVLVSQIQIVV